jgi:xylose isomerase
MPLQDLRNQTVRRTPEELVQHLKSFSLDLKISAGIWYFAPGAIRFHDAYHKPMTIEQRLEVAAKLQKYGLSAMEAHYPNEIGEDNLDLWKQWSKDTGMRILTVIPNLFWDAEFEFGSLSSPVESARRAAIERTQRTLQLNVELDTDFAVVWPGIDGYENPFGLDFYAMWDRFEEGLAEAMDGVPGVRIAIEPKPYEPRGVNIWRNTADGLLMCQRVESLLKNRQNKSLLKEGHALVAMNPEVGHVLMGFEDLPYAFARCLREGRLAHTHWNSQPLGNYDQDLTLGTVSPEQAEAGLYVMKMYGYTGYFGIDVFPERIPIERALINNIDCLRAMNDRINALDHEKIIYCTTHPDKTRGYLEALLIRSRALHPRRLSRLPALERDK